MMVISNLQLRIISKLTYWNTEVSTKKRVFWLLNHTTLREFEVPLLIEMGYEVYTPKHFPLNAGNRSASVTYEFDNGLSIPLDDVKILNQYDFYVEKPGKKIIDIINKYFDVAIVAYMFPMFDYVVDYFKGDILLRAFGLTSDHYNYFNYALEVSRSGFDKRLSSIANRFWFAAGYKNLKYIEPDFLKNRTLDLPVGLPKRVTDEKGGWVGGDKRILFVCPDINSFDESKKAYNLFKKHFGDLPHVICGSQTIPVPDDENVVGRLSSEEYKKLFIHSSVMFYHSTLPRHIHYHPEEAICYGLPLIFMKMGMLGELSGKNIPGSVVTYEEAREKVEKILAGDHNFIESLLREQEKLYTHFSPETCNELWKKNFGEKFKCKLKRSKVCLRLSFLSISGSKPELSVLQTVSDVLINVPWVRFYSGVNFSGGEYFPTSDLNLRPFTFNKVSAEDVLNCNRITGFAAPFVRNGEYIAPNDMRSQFSDSDIIFYVCSKLTKPVAPIKKYALIFIDSDKNMTKQEQDAVQLSMYNADFIVYDENVSKLIKRHASLNKDKSFELNEFLDTLTLKNYSWM